MTSRTRNISISVTALVTFLLGVGAWAAPNGWSFLKGYFVHTADYRLDRRTDSLTVNNKLDRLLEKVAHVDSDMVKLVPEIHNPKRKP